MTTLTAMPKYEAYKDSGVEWIGEIPKTWFLRKAKYLLSEVNVRSENGDETLLSLSKYHGVIPKDSLEERSGGAESLIGYKKVSVNQLVINKMQAVNGLLAVSSLDGITSPDYSVYEAKGIYSSNIKYLEYLLIQPEYLAEFKRRVTGVMEGFIRLYTDDLFAIQVVQPSLEEQARIVSFLDEKTAKIDEAIAIKQKQIELLKERKQIIIQQAVTQGLDPTVPMKDSGVEWIGKIPAHWDISHVKHVTKIISKGTTPSTIGREIYDEGDIRFIKAENLVDGEIVDMPIGYIDNKTDKLLSRSSLKEGDVLFVIAGATLGKTAIIQLKHGRANTNQAISFLRPNNLVVSEFLQFWLSTNYITQLIWLDAVQSAQPNLSMENLGNFPIVVPSIEEQREICEYIQTRIDQICILIDGYQSQINKLKEYKATLINSAVTGKIKVV